MSTPSLVAAIDEYLAADAGLGKDDRLLSADAAAAARMRQAIQRLGEEVREGRRVADLGQTFRRILVPTDGSLQASWAVTLASRMAAAGDGRLLLVHAFELPPGVLMEGMSENPAEVGARLAARGRTLLDDHVKRIGAGVPVETRIAEGHPVDQIVGLAADWEADLVAMGAHARGHLATFLLGSTAEGVVRRVKCPVLLVAHEPAVETGATDVGLHVAGAGRS